jgi:hypothetical protein
VIDGMHRVQVNIRSGAREIEVCFYDGTDDGAFVLAARANTTHGLPLSLSDRNVAARRITASRPGWPDRVVARIVPPKIVLGRMWVSARPGRAGIDAGGRL